MGKFVIEVGSSRVCVCCVPVVKARGQPLRFGSSDVAHHLFFDTVFLIDLKQAW